MRLYVRSLCGLFMILFGLLSYPERSVADPSKYPQYAQQQLPKEIVPDFIYLNQLVEEIVNGKKPLIVDVRSDEEFEESHIKAAVSIPLGEIPLRLAEIPKDKPLVLY